MFLIEYVLKPGDPGYGKGGVDLGTKGRFECPENPAYGGRRIVELPSEEHQKAFIKKNLGGQIIFTVPTDLVSSAQREMIVEVVQEALSAQREAIKEIVLEVLTAQKKPRGRPRNEPAEDSA